MLLFNVIFKLILRNSRQLELYFSSHLKKCPPPGVLYIDKHYTSVNDSAYIGCERISSVIVHDGIESIGSESFANCVGMYSVQLGSSLKSIGSFAFFNCSRLETLTIPQSVSEIGFGAFSSCLNLYIHVDSHNQDFMGQNGALFSLGNGVELLHSKENSIYLERKAFITSIGGCAFANHSFDYITLGDSVQRIGDSAFYGCRGLKSLKLPESLTFIGYEAFRKSDISNISIPRSVKTIGRYAFSECFDLDKIVLPDTVTNVSLYVFSECYALENITLGNYTEMIEEGAFYGCSSLTSIYIPKTVYWINAFAFNRCDSLEEITIDPENSHFSIDGNVLLSINGTLIRFIESTVWKYESYTIPNSVRSIAQRAFRDCTLKTVTIPESVTLIGNEVFAGSMIESIIIPNSVTVIPEYAFESCYQLSYVSMGDTVKEIGDCAFYNCEKLVSIKLPKSLISIGEGAFAESGVQNITIPQMVERFGDAVFYESQLRSVEFMSSPENIALNMFCHCYILESFTFPNSVKRIEIGALFQCRLLKELKIPKSVTEIGLTALHGGRILERIEVEEGNAHFVSKDNVLFSSDCSLLKLFPSARKGQYEVPKTVKEIERAAFAYCHLDSIVIPDSVAFIGFDAFFDCGDLVTLNIPKSLSYIDECAFCYCSSLKSVQIPNSVAEIRDSTFAYCSSLVSIEIPNSVVRIGLKVFLYCSSLVSIHIPDSVKRIDCEAFGYCSSLETVIIADSVSYVGHGVFEWCTTLKEIRLPNAISRIEYITFGQCSSLTEIRIPEGVSFIDVGAFAECTSLTNVTLSSSVTKIGSYAFEGCTNLKYVTFEGTVEPYGDISIFVNCSSELKAKVPLGYNSGTFMGLPIEKEYEQYQKSYTQTILLVCAIVGVVLVEMVVAYVKSGRLKDSDSVIEEEQAESSMKHILVYIWSILLVWSIFAVSYMGFSVFFYCSLLVLVTPLTTGLSYIAYSEHKVIELVQLITWFFFATPFIAMIISVNFRLFTRFFTNYVGLFNISRISDYIHHQLNMKRRSVQKIMTLIGLACLVLVGINAIVVLVIGDGGGMLSLMIGLITIMGPVCALFNITVRPWKSLIARIKRCKLHRRSHFIEGISEVGKDVLEMEFELDVNNTSDVQESENVKKHHMSVSDPFQIRRQDEWIGFLESESNWFIAMHGKLSIWKLITLILFGLVSIFYIVTDIIVSVDRIKRSQEDFSDGILIVSRLSEEIKGNTDTSGIVASLRSLASLLISNSSPGYVIICTVMRVLLEFYLIPFVLSANFVCVFANWKQLAKANIVRISLVISLIVSVVYSLVFIGWRVQCGRMNWNMFPDGYIYSEPGILTKITESPPAGVCSLKFGDWDLVEMAAVPMLATLKRQIDPTLFDLIWRSEILGHYDHSVFHLMTQEIVSPSHEHEFLEKIRTLSTSANLWIKASTPNGQDIESISEVYAFCGLADNGKLAFMIENVVKYWFDVLMNSLIPFFSIVRVRVMDSFMETVASIVEEGILGFETYTESKLRESTFWNSAFYSISNYVFMNREIQTRPYEFPSYIAGHSSGGLNAKAFAALKGLPVVALETPVFERSKSYQVIFGSNQFEKETHGIGWQSLFNIHSSDSIFSADEKNATANVKYPSSQLFFSVTNPYQTFCQIAAGCVSDDRYDKFCSHVVGMEQYSSYFRLWDRVRTAV